MQYIIANNNVNQSSVNYIVCFRKVPKVLIQLSESDMKLLAPCLISNMRSHSSLSNNLAARPAISKTMSTSNDREHAAASAEYVVCKVHLHEIIYVT